MSDDGSRGMPPVEHEVEAARNQFRQALIHSNETRKDVGDLEAAAAQFCQALRQVGMAPERMLIEAKHVIEGAIDGHNAPLAERAVLSCIQHYYRE